MTRTGTCLKATFSAMFATRVGGMVLNGAVDAANARVPIFSENSRDKDTVYDLFFDYCAGAGPSQCDFA
jgi:hypothetical protein